jgi:hypothetical protein
VNGRGGTAVSPQPLVAEIVSFETAADARCFRTTDGKIQKYPTEIWARRSGEKGSFGVIYVSNDYEVRKKTGKKTSGLWVNIS